MCHELNIEDEPLIALLIRDILQDDGATFFFASVSKSVQILTRGASDDYICSPSERRPKPVRNKLGRFAATL